MQEYPMEIYKEIQDISDAISISISKKKYFKCRRNYNVKTFHLIRCFTLEFKIPAIDLGEA